MTNMHPAPKYRLWYIWTISLSAALGGLLFGYDFVVINGAKPFYEKAFHLSTSFQVGWGTSCALVGCLVGALLAGGLSDRFGRKRLLILAGGLFVVTGVGVALAADTPTISAFHLFVIFRILGGVGIGLASNISPMYIAEVAPAEKRGKLVSLNQLTIVIGILLAQVVNYGINGIGDGIDQRQMAVAAPAVAAPADQSEFVKRLVAKYGPKYGENVIREEAVDKFLAAHGQRVDNEAVMEFLKGYKVNLLPSYVELARRGLVPWSETHGWRWMFGAVTFPGLFFFFAMFFVPESPRWLVKYGKSSQAQGVLAKIGGDEYAAREVEQIQETLVNEIRKVDFRELLDPRLSAILLLGVGLAVLQQWCGINTIFYYASDVFRSAGYRVSDALLNIAVIGVVNFVFTFVGIYTVDRLGRRPLILCGYIGMAAIFAVLAAAFAMNLQGVPVLALVLMAAACFSSTLGPVTWVILSEIFPNRIRGAAMSVSVFSLWLACFSLTLTFPILCEMINPAGTFALYAAICAVGFVFLFRRLPETKGRTLEELERELAQ